MGKYSMCSDGRKNADAEFEDVQQAIGPIYNLVSKATSARGKHETIITNSSTAECFCFCDHLQYYLIGDLLGKTWGEAMSSFTHHLQVWMVNCLFKVVACLIFLLFALTSPIWLDLTIYYIRGGLNQP